MLRVLLSCWQEPTPTGSGEVERHQGKGYGKAAAKTVLEEMKQDGKYDKAVLCYIEGNEAAGKLYESIGFVEIDRDEDEIIMGLELV